MTVEQLIEKYDLEYAIHNGQDAIRVGYGKPSRAANPGAMKEVIS